MGISAGAREQTRSPAALPGRELPQRAPQAAPGGILERRRVKIGEMTRHPVVGPAEADLDPARAQFDELLDRTDIVRRGGRAKASGHAILVAPYLSVPPS